MSTPAAAQEAMSPELWERMEPEEKRSAWERLEVGLVLGCYLKGLVPEAKLRREVHEEGFIFAGPVTMYHIVVRGDFRELT